MQVCVVPKMPAVTLSGKTHHPTPQRFCLICRNSVWLMSILFFLILLRPLLFPVLSSQSGWVSIMVYRSLESLYYSLSARRRQGWHQGEFPPPTGTLPELEYSGLMASGHLHSFKTPIFWLVSSSVTPKQLRWMITIPDPGFFLLKRETFLSTVFKGFFKGYGQLFQYCMV